jgi:hypothetical protein
MEISMMPIVLMKIYLTGHHAGMLEIIKNLTERRRLMEIIMHGTRNTDHAQSYLDVDKWYSSTNSPLQIITNAECRFIEAEAALRANQ